MARASRLGGSGSRHVILPSSGRHFGSGRGPCHAASAQSLAVRLTSRRGTDVALRPSRCGQRRARASRARMRVLVSLAGALGLHGPGVRRPRAGAERLRPPRRRLSEIRDQERRSGGLRRALRARRALPRLELLLSASRKAPLAACRLKNKVPPRVEDNCCVSGVRGAGVVEPRRGPIEYSIDRFGGDYRNFEVPRRSGRRTLQDGLRRRQPLPRLDLCAARLYRGGRALLPQGQDHAAAPQAVLHFGRGAVTGVARRYAVLNAPR